MRVWRLTPADAAPWRDIRLEALRAAPDSFGTRLADWQHRPLADFAARLAAVRTFAAGDGDRPLAIAGWEPTDLPRRAWVISVYARPEARGRGHAEAVIRHAMEDARATGRTEVGLGVGVHNTAARRLYARLGFVPTGAPAQPNCNGIPELDMLRPLAGPGGPR